MYFLTSRALFSPRLSHTPPLKVLSLKQPVDDFQGPKTQGRFAAYVFIDLDSVTSHLPRLPPTCLAVPSWSPSPASSVTWSHPLTVGLPRLFFFFFKCLFLREREWGRGRERHTQNPKEAPL